MLLAALLLVGCASSYAGYHPVSFAAFLRRLAGLPAVVAFVSGDRHLAEYMRIPKARLGYATVELTSSGIHTNTYRDALDRNPNPLGVAGLNFLILESRPGPPWTLDARTYGPRDRLLLTKTFTVDRGFADYLDDD